MLLNERQQANQLFGSYLREIGGIGPMKRRSGRESRSVRSSTKIDTAVDTPITI
jgi:hypothetical protein